MAKKQCQNCEGCSGCLLLIGFVTLSICVGVLASPAYGWLVFGGLLTITGIAGYIL